MKQFTASLALSLCLCGTAFAGAFPQTGDFYLISRDRGGQFVGSHKLFREYAQGLTKVTFCKRDYFVQSYSVAWTQLESERGNTVQIEYNFGKGWRPICGRPERQVTLTDLGITMSPEELLRTRKDPAAPKSRVSAISSLFQSNQPDDAVGSYHSR